MSLNSNTTGLEEILASVNALPEAGSGGGASIDTCTLEISCDESTLSPATYIAYTKYENGNISFFSERPTATGTLTYNNIVKNSMLMLNQRSSGFRTSGDISVDKNSSQSTIDYYVILNIAGDGTFYSYVCFVKGTKILLANGDYKEVQKITYDDKLLVWDFDNGEYTSAKPIWIKKAEIADYYYHCVFESGNYLDLVGSNGKCHRVFSVDDNSFLSATDCVGKNIMTYNGIEKLVSCEKVFDTVEYYNVITDCHFNLYANNVLTSTSLNNLYPIQDMKFVKEDREIIPLEMYKGVSEKLYKGLRLGERKTEDIKFLNDYVVNMIERQQFSGGD